MRRFLAHLVGDYVVQSDWMANAKTARNSEGVKAAATHAASYTACFVPFTRNPLRLAVIGGTHYLLDHYRPLEKLIRFKNDKLSPKDWQSGDVPFWLVIVVDNTLHLLINELALTGRRK